MLTPGSPIGPYEIESLLGAGGMGEVYRARDSRLGRTVALKVLSAEVAQDAGRRQRFDLEARAASALNHPGIMSVFDIGAQDGLVYIVTELIEGESLRETIKRGPLPVSKVIDLGSQVSDGLAAAHTAGIVHRDIKPENIMLTRDGRAKILDFGLAKQNAPFGAGGDPSGAATRTTPGTVLGTASYMSPEQVRGEPVDHRSDIFSLGLVLHECLTGKQTFERPTGVEMMTAILREDAPELPETVPPALRQIVAHCLEKEPDRRFHSARDLAFALRTASTGTRGSAPSLPLTAPLPERPGSASPAPADRVRNWFWPALAALLAIALAGVATAHFLELQPIELSGYRITPFEAGDEPESQGTWSPDGSSIAYLKMIGGVPQVMVRPLDGDAPVQLTRSAAPVRQLFWKPDSSLIYYLEEESRGVLWGISPSGGEAARILEIPGRLISAAVSPDGKTIAMWRGMADGLKVRGEVWISSPPGAPPTRYSAATQSAELNAENRIYFSPDGSSLLLLTGFNASELWLVPFPSPAPPRRLFAKMDLGISAKASWFPDSRHAVLAFAQGLSEPPSLWLADLKRERLRRLTAGTVGHDYPSLSPAGRRMVFTTVQDDYDVVSLPLDGGAPRRLAPNTRNEMSPSWSPDGEQIIYSSDRSGQLEIWIRNLKAGIDRPVMTARQFPAGTTKALVDPVFSPDGKRFAFVRYSTGDPVTIWVAPSVGGAPIRMTPEYMQSPAWSPDGGTLTGLMQRDNPWQPAVIGVGADMSAHIVPGGPICRTPPDWSPKGDWIACESQKGLELFSPDGSTSKHLPPVNAVAIVFSRDGNTIYAAAREGGRTVLKAVDVANGTARIIADYGVNFTISGGLPFNTRLSLAPDGKSLAASAGTRKSDLWLLEGFPLPRPWWQNWR